MQPRVSTELLGLDSDGAALAVPAVVVVVVAAVLGVVVGVASAVAGVVVEEAAVVPDVGSCASPPWPLLGSFGTRRATSSQAPLPRAVSIAICVPSGTRGSQVWMVYTEHGSRAFLTSKPSSMVGCGCFCVTSVKLWNVLVDCE